VHSNELNRLAESAKALEAQGKLREARAEWLRSVPLLPAGSNQAKWVYERAGELDRRAHELALQAPAPQPQWVRRLGPLAPLAALLLKGKGLLVLLKLPSLLTLFLSMGVYASLYGVRFGIGFALLILVHEMGHFLDVKRRGLPADMPIFLPGFRAYVRWQALGVPPSVRAQVSLAGPLAGLLSAVFCAAVWIKTGDPLWAALARSAAWLNALNLIPVWMLDGGQAISVLGRGQRIGLLVAALALGLISGEGMIYLVALGAGWRLFTRDLPHEPNWGILTYFLSVLTALALLLRMIPGQGV
jgi:Zn-dependent protease